MAFFLADTVEFSDHFKPYFENCPPEIEKALHVPLAPIVSTPNAFGGHPYTSPSLPSQAMLLDVADQHLRNHIAKAFHSRNRNPQDYTLLNARVLRNPAIWQRYQDEKLSQRQLYQQKLQAEMASKMTVDSTSNSQPLSSSIGIIASSVQPEPQAMFRDEILFHATKVKNIPSILSRGLDPKMTVRASCGKGVYFSDSIEKCMQYVDTQTSMDQEYCILLCCVILGNVLVEPYDYRKRTCTTSTLFLPEGYNAAVLHHSFKEWVIFEKAQILPLCVLNFKASDSPTSYFRLSHPSVIHSKTCAQATSIHSLPRKLTVQTPSIKPLHLRSAKPYGGSGMIDSLAFTWRAPEPVVENMLAAIFNIPARKAQVKNFMSTTDTGLDWVVRAPDQSGQDMVIVLKELQLESLIGTTKNIDLLSKRLEEMRLINLQEQNRQRYRIEAALRRVHNGEEILRWHADDFKQLNQASWEYQQGIVKVDTLQNELQRVLQLVPSNNFEATQLRFRLEEVQASLITYHDRYLQGVSMLAHFFQVTIAEVDTLLSIVQMRAQLQELVRKNQERETMQEDSIQSEKIRANRFGHSLYKTTSIIEVEQYEAEIKQRLLLQGGTAGSVEFVHNSTAISTISAPSWPTIVAELLMPGLMISQLPYDRQLALSITDANNLMSKVGALKGWLRGGTGQVLNWWDIAPMAVFAQPTPSSQFWPVDPRTRLPSSRLLYMIDYFEWLFLEKESRVRIHRKRSEAAAAAATSISGPSISNPDNSAVHPLAGLDLDPFLNEKWSQMDPGILRAIEGLSSRFGTVPFKRKERQAELEKLGTDLMQTLFVQAESSMLIPDEVASAAAGTPKADCPICTDPLVITDSHSATTATATTTTTSGTDATDRRVVKLQSCRHCFHETCIMEWFQSKDAQLKCPMCNTMCTSASEATTGAFKGTLLKLGPMPDGVMGYCFDPRLCCYFIFITTPEHTIPNPESPQGPAIVVPQDVRCAIVPFSGKLGPLLMIRLICLYYYGHMFRVGTSLTRGVDNVVVWNGVHLRTSLVGEYGFPAENFEANCWRELDQKGIAMGLEELVLGMLGPDRPSFDQPAGRVGAGDQNHQGGPELAPGQAPGFGESVPEISIFHPMQPLLFVTP